MQVKLNQVFGFDRPTSLAEFQFELTCRRLHDLPTLTRIQLLEQNFILLACKYQSQHLIQLRSVDRVYGCALLDCVIDCKYLIDDKLKCPVDQTLTEAKLANKHLLKKQTVERLHLVNLYLPENAFDVMVNRGFHNLHVRQGLKHL